MYQANFIYNKTKITILCEGKASLKELFNIFINKAEIQNKEMVFLYNGNKINNENKTVDQLSKDKSFIIIVNDDNNNIHINSIYVENNIVKYKIKNKGNGKIRIFGRKFVNNNKNKLKIEIEGEEFELMEYYDNKDNKLEIKLKLKKIGNFVDISYMFFGCSSLLSLSDISKWDTSNVINMEYMFFGCSSLLSLPDISKWDTSNVMNMSNLFNNCSSLLNLPDISKWDTSNVKDISNIFARCMSLLNLPDLSKWDTSNVIIYFLFVHHY